MPTIMEMSHEPNLCSWEIEVRHAEIEFWRRSVSCVFREWRAPRAVVELAFFGVSELLSNIIKHTNDRRCLLEVTRNRTGAGVSVFDRSPELPVVRKPEWDAESGRGLWLLQQMTAGTGFGFERTRPPWAKVVWLRCALGPDSGDTTPGRVGHSRAG